MALVFKFSIGPGFIFESVVNFYIINSHIPFTTLGLDLFLSAHLSKLCSYGAQRLRLTQSTGSIRLSASLPEN